MDDRPRNVILLESTDDKILINYHGINVSIERNFEALLDFFLKDSTQSIQTADTIFNIGHINHANFNYLMGMAGKNKSFPNQLSDSLLGEGNLWIQNLRQELLKRHLSIRNDNYSVFQNYGWLVETFLFKMSTPIGQERSLRRLSFMVEAYQASLRYLAYIQMASLLMLTDKPKPGIVNEFIHMQGDQYLRFDYTSLLLIVTEALGKKGFIEEIFDFTRELQNTESILFSSALFLDAKRQELLANKISQDDSLEIVLDEYLTALVHWLRRVSFLGKYSLASVKEITLKFGLGTPENYIHLYGELHGFYEEIDPKEGESVQNHSNRDNEIQDDYNRMALNGFYTFNKSVLLFKGTDVPTAMDQIKNGGSFLSLSPFLIDQSVYAEKLTQTPEIYYYTGYDKTKSQYSYSQYKNELVFGESKKIISNKHLSVSGQNIKQPPLDELYEQLEIILSPLKA